MDAGTSLVIAVPAAVLGAAGFGLASAAQQRATKEVAVARTLDPTLLTRLWARPMWMLGLAATVLALLLQLLALAFGPLAVVQPLLVTGVAFAGMFSALLAHRRPDPLILVGALFCAAGLSAFLLLARPVAAGDATAVHLGSWLPMVIALIAVVAGCLAFAATVRHPSRVLALALATGVLYGVTAGLMKVVTEQVREGIDEPFRHPVLYIVCIVGPMGFLLSQNTFQQGRLVSPAVAVITSVDPAVGVLVGVAWLNEQLNVSPSFLAGECLAGLLVVAGIVLITARGTHLLHRLDEGSAVRAPGRADPTPG